MQRQISSRSNRREPRLHGRTALGSQKGVALVGVLLLTAAILALGIFGTQGAQVELNIAGNDLRSEKALALAEAGVHHTYALVKKASDTTFYSEVVDGTGGSLVGIGSIVAVDGENYRFRHLGLQANDGYYVRINDNFDEVVGANDPTRDLDFVVSIVSRGRVGNAERVVEAVLEGTSAFPVAIFGEVDLSLGGGMNTDSFDSRISSYDPATAGNEGDVRSNGDVDVNPATVKGDATASGVVKLGSGTVTGTVTEGADPLDFPSVRPCGPPYSNGNGITGTGNWNYDSSTGALTVNNGSVTLSDGKYCFSSIKETSDGRIDVNGPVFVMVTGEVDATGGGINNTTQIASNFLLASSYNEDKEGVKITAQGNTYVAVYAPDTRIKVNGGADFFGSLIGLAVNSQGQAGLHYDEALKGAVKVGAPKIVSWTEERNF